MADNYIIDPSNQQGQPQNRTGSVGAPNKATAPKEIIPGDQLREGPEEIPDHSETLSEAGEGPIPLPDHPGKLLKLEPGKPMRDTSRVPMGKKIGKDIH